ncbi:MAG TPA: nitrilase-related carbon-nitrogen hydrolase, partial [Hyphomicrobiales bacterium]
MNPTVGDLDGNVRRITAWLREANKAKPDLVAFPELSITGYPPEDLLLKPQFVADNRSALNDVIRACRDCVAVVGYVGQGSSTGLREGAASVLPAGRHELYNAAA